MSKNPLAIQIKDLNKTYADGTQALKGINLEIEEGDFFALLGANGAGKTTIIGILTSLVNKSKGEVKVFDYDLDSDINKVKEQIGVVPQEFNFSIFEKVQDIVVQQSGYFGVPREEALKRSEQILKDLELWDKRNTKAMALSGGMKRRLMIARALMHHPRLLILDEPTAGVDVQLRRGMWDYLKRLNKSGTTILLTTHYLEEVEELCRNVAMIKDGVIIKQDTVKNAMKSVPERIYTVEVEKVTKDFSPKGFAVQYIDRNTVEVKVKDTQSINEMIKAFNDEQVEVRDISAKGGRMEQLFLNLLNQ